ncbi:MAG: amidohydrolase family protein [Gammaproteobacteria bacterium]
MFDLIIRNGSVVDGSGAPRRLADVAIQGGVIRAIGRVDDQSGQTLDAGGQIVAPGFVDVHTHYDAQVFWDPSLTPSSNHGVTSVIGGNCGFSIAPLTPEAGAYLMPMLARVEGMPLESLRLGVPWNWRSFGEYLAKIEGRIAINAGFMVGHSALRRVVMGERAVGHEASPADLLGMVSLLRRSLAEGGMGFSSTISNSHNDADGAPVPSRHASRDELLALAGVLRDFPGTSLEFLPGPEEFDDAKKQLMADLSLAANRPLNWNAIGVTASNGAYVRAQLSASDFARARGAEVVALTVPDSTTLRINLVSGFMFDMVSGWADFFRLPPEERKRQMADPGGRRSLRDRAAADRSYLGQQIANFAGMRVEEVFAPINQAFVGRTLGEAAAGSGREVFDLFCEIALADDLRTSFTPAIETIADDSKSTWLAKRSVWLDDRTLIGASDAGAHLDMIDTFAIPTRVLEKGVRQHGILTLEQAIHQLCDLPARLYGLRGRGRIAEGWQADIVVFDERRIGCRPVSTRFDLPGGAGRIFAEAEGIEHVLVNGVEILRGSQSTGKLPGAVFRSGRDTQTVDLSQRWFEAN